VRAIVSWSDSLEGVCVCACVCVFVCVWCVICAWCVCVVCDLCVMCVCGVCGMCDCVCVYVVCVICAWCVCGMCDVCVSFVRDVCVCSIVFYLGFFWGGVPSILLEWPEWRVFAVAAGPATLRTQLACSEWCQAVDLSPRDKPFWSPQHNEAIVSLFAGLFVMSDRQHYSYEEHAQRKQSWHSVTSVRIHWNIWPLSLDPWAGGGGGVRKACWIRYLMTVTTENVRRVCNRSCYVLHNEFGIALEF
jgi:hypothetical protein